MEFKNGTNFEYTSESTRRFLSYIGINFEHQKINGRTGYWHDIELGTACFIKKETNPLLVLTEYIGIFAIFEHESLGDLTDYIVCYYDYENDKQWKELDIAFDCLENVLIELDILAD